jgi:hypothetical protein
MMRWFYVMWFMFGLAWCKGQEVRMPIYGELELRAEYYGADGYMVDSVDLHKLLLLCRSLRVEADAAGAVAVEGRKCEEMVDSAMVLAKMERGIWEERLALQGVRSDFYMERMAEEVRRGKGMGWKWGVIGGTIGSVVGFVLGTVIK